MAQNLDHQDDGEAFADDDPHDLVYRLHVDEYRHHLTLQLHAVTETHPRRRGREDFDPEAFAAYHQENVLPRPKRSGHVEVGRDEHHARVQEHLDTINDPELRARVANEVLTLAGALHQAPEEA